MLKSSRSGNLRYNFMHIDSLITRKTGRNEIALLAPAKINLGLKVLNKRDDGFHDIITIMQCVTLYDRIRLSKKKDDQAAIRYLGPELTRKPEDNLCYRALKIFSDTFKIRDSLIVELHKEIPVGAGLGGGSSDAASVLLGLRSLYEKSSYDDIFQDIALQLGSDIPFFLLDEAAAIAEGRGEVLTPIKGLEKDYDVVIIYPGIEVSTGWAYQEIDKSLTLQKESITLKRRDFFEYKGQVPTTEMRNDFEIPIFATYPELVRGRDLLLDAGAEYAGVTGSGSALYGIFGVEAVTRAAEIKAPQPWLRFVCRPC